MPRGKPHLNPILMATSVAVDPLSVKNTLDAQSLPGPSSSLSATCVRRHTRRSGRSGNRKGWQRTAEKVHFSTHPHHLTMA